MENESYIKAIKLVTIAGGKSHFYTGRMPNKTYIASNGFFAQTHIEAYEKIVHTAPRKQYVVTLRGKLEFKVSNGATFIIEPGVVLIATDTEGDGHSWDLIEGDTWQRLYIPLADGGDDHFIAD